MAWEAQVDASAAPRESDLVPWEIWSAQSHCPLITEMPPVRKLQHEALQLAVILYIMDASGW